MVYSRIYTVLVHLCDQSASIAIYFSKIKPCLHCQSWIPWVCIMSSSYLLCKTESVQGESCVSRLIKSPRNPIGHQRAYKNVSLIVQSSDKGACRSICDWDQESWLVKSFLIAWSLSSSKVLDSLFDLQESKDKNIQKINQSIVNLRVCLDPLISS